MTLSGDGTFKRKLRLNQVIEQVPNPAALAAVKRKEEGETLNYYRGHSKKAAVCEWK